MRRLIYIPIAHTPREVGEEYLCGAVARPDLLPAYSHLIDAYWDGVERRFLNEGIDKVYHDCAVRPQRSDFEHLASQGSRNAAFIVSLADRGAKLMCTESSVLVDAQKRCLGDLVLTYIMRDLRDMHVTGQIDRSLREGETGAAFFGFSHRIDQLLERNPSMRVERHDEGLGEIISLSAEIFRY